MLRVACVMWVVAACGHQRQATGTPDAPPADAAPQSVVLGSLTDACAGIAGFDGQQAVSMLKAAYSATYSPIPSGTASTLSLVVTYSTGQITCNTPYGGELDMPPSITLGVQASFATSDGTFNEQFAAQLTLSSQSNGELGFAGTVPIASLHGTYAPQLAGTWTTHDVSFGGQIYAGGTTTGSIEEQAATGNIGQVTGAGNWQ
jgi:hypothetical protein